MSGASRGRLWAAYRPPLLLSLIGIVGLVGALVGDGAFDAASWLALGVLVTIVVARGVRR